MGFPTTSGPAGNPVKGLPYSRVTRATWPQSPTWEAGLLPSLQFICDSIAQKPGSNAWSSPVSLKCQGCITAVHSEYPRGAAPTNPLLVFLVHSPLVALQVSMAICAEECSHCTNAAPLWPPLSGLVACFPTQEKLAGRTITQDAPSPSL